MNKIFTLLLVCISLNCAAQTLTGTASFYSNKFNGRKTATGAIFSNNGLTCACNKLPLGTRVRVTNLRNGSSIELVVNDRLAANNRRLVDLTERAAKQIGFYNAGLTQVKVEVISKKKDQNQKEKNNKSEIKEEPRQQEVKDTLNHVLDESQKQVIDSTKRILEP